MEGFSELGIIPAIVPNLNGSRGVHYQTVADDYYAAMKQTEKRLDLFGEQEDTLLIIHKSERTQLLDLMTELA